MMPVTEKEIVSFTQFAAQRLKSGDPIPSMEECLRQWRADREREELAADVTESLADYAAGRSKPLREAFDDVRRKLGTL